MTLAGEELARPAAKLGLKDAVDLRIRTETCAVRRRLQGVTAGINQTDEMQQPEARAIANQGDTQVPVQVAADLAGMSARFSRQLIETGFRITAQEL